MSEQFDQWVVFVGVFGGIRLADIGHRIAAQLPSHSRSVSAGHSPLVAIRPSVRPSIHPHRVVRKKPAKSNRAKYPRRRANQWHARYCRSRIPNRTRAYFSRHSDDDKSLIYFRLRFRFLVSVTFVIVCCRFLTIFYNNIKYITYSIVTHV